MSQFILLTYAISLIFGLITIGASGALALWTRKKSLLLSFLFYLAYTFDMFAEIIHKYILINIPFWWEKLSLIWNPVMIFSRFFLLFAILISTHCLLFRGCRKRSVFIYSLFTAVCSLISLIIYINSGQSETLENSIPDYIYFVLIPIILTIGVIHIYRSKQIVSEFLNQLEYSLTKKVFVTFLLSSPLIINDDLIFLKSTFKFAPLVYTLISLLLLYCIIRLFLSFRISYGSNDPANSTEFEKYGISEREKEIILLVLKGYSNKQISEKLFISLSTVKSHIYTIFKKMNVKTRFELMQAFRSV